MRYQNIRSLSFSFITIHACDRQTDGQTELRQQYRVLHYMQSHGKKTTPFPQILFLHSHLSLAQAYLLNFAATRFDVWQSLAVAVLVSAAD